MYWTKNCLKTFCIKQRKKKFDVSIFIFETLTMMILSYEQQLPAGVNYLALPDFFEKSQLNFLIPHYSFKRNEVTQS